MVPRRVHPRHARIAREARKSEVDCRDCSRPTAVARSYVWEYGFLCHACHAVKQRRASAMRVEAATGPLESVLEGVVRALAGLPPRPSDNPFR